MCRIFRVKWNFRQSLKRKRNVAPTAFHFGDRSSRDMNEEQELEQAAGESVTQLSLAAESKEEPRLLLLSRSDERQL